MQSLDATEWDAWIAYNRLSPIGQERADLRAGIIASVIANSNRDPKKQPRAFEPRDFMPFVGEDAGDEMTPEETAEMFERLLGGVRSR